MNRASRGRDLDAITRTFEQVLTELENVGAPLRSRFKPFLLKEGGLAATIQGRTDLLARAESLAEQDTESDPERDFYSKAADLVGEIRTRLSGALTVRDVRAIARERRFKSALALVKRMEWAGALHVVDDVIYAGPPPEVVRHVPTFKVYFARESDLDTVPGARNFFERFCVGLESDEAPDVEGNWTYVFLYLNRILNEYIASRKSALTQERLRRLLTLYGDAESTTLPMHLRSVLTDILLLEGDRERTWDLFRGLPTRPWMLLTYGGPDTPIRGLELMRTANASIVTTAGRKYVDEITTAADQILNDIHNDLGMNFACFVYWRLGSVQDLAEWAERLDLVHSRSDLDRVPYTAEEDLALRPRVEVGAFQGALHDGALLPGLVRPIVERRQVRSWDKGDRLFERQAQIVIREAENIVRRSHGLPGVSEGWISEYELYREIAIAFPQEVVVHQGQPRWLGRQRFDVYLPDRNVAIEYQGAQHFEPIPLFGGEEGFLETQARDARKRALCTENDCILIEVLPDYRWGDVLASIQRAIAMR